MLLQVNYICTGPVMQVKVAGILARSDLLITRNVEWANIAFGFEQVSCMTFWDPTKFVELSCAYKVKNVGFP